MSFEKADVYLMVDSSNVNGKNKLKKIGEVFFNDHDAHGKSDYCPLEVVEKINKKVLDMISGQMRALSEGGYHHYSHEDINVHIILEMRWRRCRGFLAIQKSSRGIRYLVYLADYVFHGAASFGTSAEYVDYDQVKTDFIKEVKKIRDNWHIHKDSFSDLTDDDFDMDKFDERFGLSN